MPSEAEYTSARGKGNEEPEATVLLRRYCNRNGELQTRDRQSTRVFSGDQADAVHAGTSLNCTDCNNPSQKPCQTGIPKPLRSA